MKLGIVSDQTKGQGRSAQATVAQGGVDTPAGEDTFGDGHFSSGVFQAQVYPRNPYLTAEQASLQREILQPRQVGSRICLET
jgi:hypothetical protein